MAANCEPKVNKEGENDSSGLVATCWFPSIMANSGKSDEVGCSAVNRRVASSNLARGANSFFNQWVRDCSFSVFGDRSKRSICLGIFQKRADKNGAKPQCFCDSAPWKGPTLRFGTEWSGMFSTDWCTAIWIAPGCPDHNRGSDPAESPVNTSPLLIPQTSSNPVCGRQQLLVYRQRNRV